MFYWCVGSAGEQDDFGDFNSVTRGINLRTSSTTTSATYYYYITTSTTSNLVCSPLSWFLQHIHRNEKKMVYKNEH